MAQFLWVGVPLETRHRDPDHDSTWSPRGAWQSYPHDPSDLEGQWSSLHFRATVAPKTHLLLPRPDGAGKLSMGLFQIMTFHYNSTSLSLGLEAFLGSPPGICSQIPGLGWSCDHSPGPSCDTAFNASSSSSTRCPSSSSSSPSPTACQFLLTQDVFLPHLFPLQFPLQPRLLHTKVRKRLLLFPLPPSVTSSPRGHEPGCLNGRRVGKEGNTVGEKISVDFSKCYMVDGISLML